MSFNLRVVIIILSFAESLPFGCGPEIRCIIFLILLPLVTKLCPPDRTFVFAG